MMSTQQNTIVVGATGAGKTTSHHCGVVPPINT